MELVEPVDRRWVEVAFFAVPLDEDLVVSSSLASGFASSGFASSGFASSALPLDETVSSLASGFDGVSVAV